MNQNYQENMSYNELINNNTPWCIVDPQQGTKYVNNLEYLNYLLEKTPEIIQSRDKHRIKFLYWDYQELKNAGLSPLYDLTINSQINSLKRIMNCIHFKDYKPNVYINIEDD